MHAGTLRVCYSEYPTFGLLREVFAFFCPCSCERYTFHKEEIEFLSQSINASLMVKEQIFFVLLLKSYFTFISLSVRKKKKSSIPKLWLHKGDLCLHRRNACGKQERAV